MQVINSLIEQSFEYTAKKKNLAVRRDEIGDLMEVIAINISLGGFPACVSTVKEYVQERREILSSIKKVMDYEAFMQSCFINSRFAKGILSEMKHISNFSDNTKEITKALGVLNDYAVKLYQQYSNRLEEAMRILSVKLQRECAPDSKHAEELMFTFTYSENIEGDQVPRTKDVECSPHLKLLLFSAFRRGLCPY